MVSYYLHNVDKVLFSLLLTYCCCFVCFTLHEAGVATTYVLASIYNSHGKMVSFKGPLFYTFWCFILIFVVFKNDLNIATPLSRFSMDV